MGRRFIGLLLLLGLMAAPAAAQETTPPAPDITAQFKQLEDITQSIRGLETLKPVEKAFPTRADIQAYIKHSLDKALTTQIMTEAEAFYWAFDLLDPKKTPLREAYEKLLGQQVAGYYDTDTKSMNVVETGPADTAAKLGLLERIIYVHEFTHALQDQYFDLDAYMQVAQDAKNNDMALARAALVEGDATYVMNEYAIQESQKNPLGALLELATSSAQAGGLALPPDTPSILAAELLFPYLAGEIFVRAVRENGGQEALDRAFINPPQSTEQIMHPELYLTGDNPDLVTLPVTPPDETWTPITSGVLGEFYLEQMLLEQLSPDDAATAAAGWGGDAYQIYQQDDGTQAWALTLVWDTPADKTEFETIFDNFVQAQFGVTAKDGCYIGTEGYKGAKPTACVVWNDSGSHIAYGPTPAIVRQLLQAEAVR